MNVFHLVTDELAIDEDRIYLWGHSMGGAGTYYLASRYPDTWAGLAAVAGGSMTAAYVDADAIRHIRPRAPGLRGPRGPRRASARVGGEDAGARDAAPLHRDPRRRPLAVHLGDPEVVGHLFSFFNLVSKKTQAGAPNESTP